MVAGAHVKGGRNWLKQLPVSRLLASLFVVLILSPFLLLSVIYIHISQNYAKETYGKYLTQSLGAVQEQIDETSRRFVDGTMNFYNNGLVELLEKDRLTEEEELILQSKLKDILNSYSGSVSSVFLNYKGKEYSCGVRYQDIQKTMEPYEKELSDKKGRHIWFGPFQCLPKSKSGKKMILGKYLNGIDKKEIATVYLVIDLEEFSDAFQKKELQNTADFLFDGKGRLLYGSNLSENDEQLKMEQLLTLKKGGYDIVKNGRTSYLAACIQSKRTKWIAAITIPMKELLRDFTPVKIMFLLLTGIYIMFLFAMLFLMERYVARPVRSLTDRMDSFAKGKMEQKVEELSIGELNRLNRHFNQMTVQIAELMKRNEEEVREKNEFKMQTLRASLSPHFIYNSLNTIKWMAAINRQDNIQNVTEALIQLLMSHTKGSEEEYRLKDEIALIENYAVVQKARFMNFDIQYENADDVADCRITKFLLQPVVENAIIHGFARGKKRRGIIRITACKKADSRDFAETAEKLYIVIEDNGIGFDVEEWEQRPEEPDKEHTHVAIKNIRQIIRLEYGSGYGMTIKSELGVGTRVEYVLPVRPVRLGAEVQKKEVNL